MPTEKPLSAFNWREMSLLNRAEYKLPELTKINSGKRVTQSIEKKRETDPAYGTLHGITKKALRLAPKPFKVYSKARKGADAEQ